MLQPVTIKNERGGPRGRQLVSKREAHINANRFRAASFLVMRTASERAETLDEITEDAHNSVLAEIQRFGIIKGSQL